MVIGNFQYLLLLIQFINAQIVRNGQTHEVKSKHAQHLCGETFIHVWKYICNIKAKSVSIKTRKVKRSIEDVVKPRSSDLIPSNGALQFLNPRRKRRYVLLGGLDDAVEECCYESCTFSEVAEYAC